jgi:transposase InsO family protein
MSAQPDRWCQLSAESIRWVPEAAGVFEVANLVRSVLYVGRGEGNLRARGLLPPIAGGVYFRFRLTPEEEEAYERLVGAYRMRHDGCDPRLNGAVAPAGTQRDAA